MSKRQMLMALGAWTMVAGFLGFPGAVKIAVFVLTGAVTIAVAYRLPSASPARPANPDEQPYVDHRRSE